MTKLIKTSWKTFSSFYPEENLHLTTEEQRRKYKNLVGADSVNDNLPEFWANKYTFDFWLHCKRTQLRKIILKVRDITEILIFTTMTACAVSHGFHSKNRHQTSLKTTFSCHSTKPYTILCPFSSIRFGLQHYIHERMQIPTPKLNNSVIQAFEAPGFAQKKSRNWPENCNRRRAMCRHTFQMLKQMGGTQRLLNHLSPVSLICETHE